MEYGINFEWNYVFDFTHKEDHVTTKFKLWNAKNNIKNVNKK